MLNIEFQDDQIEEAEVYYVGSRPSGVTLMVEIDGASGEITLGRQEIERILQELKKNY